MIGSSWLFRHETLAWLGDRELRRQLPPAFRLFARFCRAQRWLGGSRVLGGEPARRLAARFAARSAEGESVALAIGGRTIHLDLLDPRMLEIPNELAGGLLPRRLAQWLQRGDTFVDVGANHGSFSLLASERVGGDGLVVACEPQARLAALIERSLAANARSPFRVLAVACGDRDAEAVLYVPEDSSGYAGLFAAFSGAAASRRFDVPVRRFDDLCDWRRFPGRVLVKLDVEGSESAFLAGATAMIRGRAPQLLLEVNASSLAVAGSSIGDLRERLRGLGYDRYGELDEPERLLPLTSLGAERQRDVYLPSPPAPPG